ncbi:MAG: D-isomer specific 2-hydroxyacid dehydrogenase NAD-binding protein [Parcubacteria group bacterium GW2011_GWC1_43_12]|nr:MAG: D-isomer specific 2-hydroxyacid dehydrogenase NAD-binding protein [Parcubacteria group bacterium GW2011_GWB1_42_6]KKS92474.1 MAG: D-isomer specific 2-hydroxyacid dehydrogenase NAD-binding protein [Parcubacteria group bacterium GW2011_GWC1_43_12]
MPKVFVTRRIPEIGINMLKEKGYDVEVSDVDGVLPRKVLLEKVKGADAVLSLLTDKINAEFLDAAGPQLKIVANYAVGFDNIDVKALNEKNVIAANTPGVLNESVAEMSITLLLAIAKKVVEADKFMREGKYKGWGPMMFLGNDLAGKTLGLIGLGRIGQVVAQRMSAGFEMKVIYYDIKRNEEAEKKYNLEYRDLESLLKDSDFVSIHVPMTPETKHLLGADQFKMMKKTAYLVNTARGPVIDENALVEALKAGLIKGVALDVYENEPAMAEGLKDLPNTILIPHIASATEETRGAMSELAAKNIIAALSGEEPMTPIKI